MTGLFIVQSVSSATRLEFEGVIPRDDDGPYTIQVSLVGENVQARGTVDDMAPRQWSAFFAGIARDWSSWEGDRAHASLEGQLQLTCTADRPGAVTFRVELRGTAGSDWFAADSIDLVPSQLEELARQAEAYFG